MKNFEFKSLLVLFSVVLSIIPFGVAFADDGPLAVSDTHLNNDTEIRFGYILYVPDQKQEEVVMDRNYEQIVWEDILNEGEPNSEWIVNHARKFEGWSLYKWTARHVNNNKAINVMYYYTDDNADVNSQNRSKEFIDIDVNEYIREEMATGGAASEFITIVNGGAEIDSNEISSESEYNSDDDIAEAQQEVGSDIDSNVDKVSDSSNDDYQPIQLVVTSCLIVLFIVAGYFLSKKKNS